MALASSKLFGRHTQLGDPGDKENIRDGANKKRTKSVTDQVNNKKEHRRCHCPDAHAYNTLPHGVLRR